MSAIDSHRRLPVKFDRLQEVWSATSSLRVQVEQSATTSRHGAACNVR